MKRRPLVLILLLALLWSSPASAQTRVTPTNQFVRCEYVTDPQISERVRFALLPSDDLFRPLLTDPKEPRSSIEFRNAKPQGSSASPGTLRARTAGVTAGGVLGLWARKTGECRGIEISALTGVFGQFNVDSPSYDLIGADFLIGAQIAIRSNRLSGRLRVVHQTNHLGEDFTSQNPVLIDLNLGSETIEALGSIDGTELRAYAGLGYVVFLHGNDRSVLAHAGAEFRSTRTIRGALRPLAGVDVQSLQIRSWAITATATGGVEWVSDAFARRLRLLVVAADGYSPFGDVSLQRKSRSIGAQLQIEF